MNGAINAANFRYVQPLLGNNGTCGRNTERLNDLLNFDWTFSKDIRLRESGPLQSGPAGLELRADFFNIFNVPYLTAAGDDFRRLASPNFAVANAAGATRRVQIALRLTFWQAGPLQRSGFALRKTFAANRGVFNALVHGSS